MTLIDQYLLITKSLRDDKTLPKYFHEFMDNIRQLCVGIDKELDRLEQNASDENLDTNNALDKLEERLDRI